MFSIKKYEWVPKKTETYIFCTVFYFKLNCVKPLKYEIIQFVSYSFSPNEQVHVAKIVVKSHTNFHDHWCWSSLATNENKFSSCFMTPKLTQSSLSYADFMNSENASIFPSNCSFWLLQVRNIQNTNWLVYVSPLTDSLVTIGQVVLDKKIFHCFSHRVLC